MGQGADPGGRWPAGQAGIVRPEAANPPGPDLGIPLGWDQGAAARELPGAAATKGSRSGRM